MFLAVHSSCLTAASAQDSVAGALAAAASAGFAAVELELPYAEPPIADCRRAPLPIDIRQLGAAGLRIAALCDPAVTAVDWFPRSPAVRTRAIARLAALLELAAGFGAPLVTIPLQPRWPTDPQAHDDAAQTRDSCFSELLYFAADFLLEARFEAQAWGVCLALDWSAALPSPAAAADFLDHINSPAVGWCLRAEPGGAFPPQHWALTLGARVVNVHVPQLEADPGHPAGADADALVAALRRTRYAGPVVYRGRADPGVAGRRLGALLGRNLPAGAQDSA